MTSRSKWGVIRNPDEYPAGLLFLRLKFFQPKKYRLNNATIKMDFVTPTSLDAGPYILDYQPVQLCGIPHEQDVSRTFELKPQINVGVGGGGLGSVGRSKEYKQTYRWTFSGSQEAVEGGHFYTRMIWKWEGQQKGTDVPFERPIDAAVAIQHDLKPFVIKVEIEGKLKAWQHSWRRWKFKPQSKTSPQLMPAVTTPPEDLGDLIENLEHFIRTENHKHSAHKLPDIQSVNAQSAPILQASPTTQP